MAKTRSGVRGVRVLELPRGSGIYWGRYVDPLTRKTRQVALGHLRTAGARSAWAKGKLREIVTVREKLRVGEVVAERIALADAVNAYLANFSNRRTEVGKRLVLESFATWMVARRVQHAADLTQTILVRWRDDHLQPGEGLAMATRNRWLAATSAFLRWASDRGWTPHLSYDAIRRGTKRAAQPAKAIEFLRPAQLRQVLEAVQRHDMAGEGKWRPLGPFVMTLALTGARYTEVADLTWAEVDFDEDCLRLAADRTKTARSRIIDLSIVPTLRALLAGMALRRGDREQVFDVGTYGLWQHALTRLVRDYGCPLFTPHHLRRSHGTVLVNSSIFTAAGPWMAAKRLGHSVAIAESRYNGQLSGLPMDAKTFEQAAGITEACNAIVRAHGGLVVDEQAAATSNGAATG